MVGVILAAGVGRRLEGICGDVPKCLIPLGGMPLIWWQVRAFVLHGAGRLAVVVGFKAEAVEETFRRLFPDVAADFILNPDYATTNTLYSLHLALKRTNEDVLFTNGDVFFGPELVRRLLTDGGSAIAVCRHECGQEEVKVLAKGQGVAGIGKEIPPVDCVGEFVGVAVWRRDDLGAIREALEHRAGTREGRQLFFEAAVQDALPDLSLRWVDVSDLPVVEIDFPSDYQQAKELVTSVKAEWDAIKGNHADQAP